MKRVILTILIIALLAPQIMVAQEVTGITEKPSYLTDFEVNNAERMYSVGKKVTTISALVATGGAIAWWIGEQYINKQLDHTDSVDGAIATFGMAQTLLGGLGVVAALPFYLWGMDIKNNPNGMGVAMGNHNRGFGGRLDVGYGFTNTPNIGGSLGYNFNSRLFVGLGAGCEYYLDGEGPYHEPSIPVYADVRWQFGNNRVTPYLGVKAGFDITQAYIPYGSVDWGVSLRCCNSSGAWWCALSLCTTHHNNLSFKISRSF